MFSKLRVHRKLTATIACLAVAAAVALFGCSGQNDPYNNLRNIQLSGAMCMDQIPAQIHDYFGGIATVNETHALWGCFRYMLTMFSTYVRAPGAQDQYTPQGLRNFLEKYFLKNEVPAADGHVISDRLLSELMQLKTVFIGGSPDLITGAEVQRTLNLINHLDSISIDLLPYSRIIFFNTGAQNPSIKQVDGAMQAVSSATMQLATLIDHDRTPYTFDDLKTLTQSIYNFLARQNPNSKFLNVAPYIPLFAKLKATVLNSNDTAIEPQDWLGLAQLGARIYTIVIRKKYFLTADSLDSTNQLDELSLMFSTATNIIETASSRWPKETVPLSEIDGIIDQAIPLGILPKTIDATTAHALVKSLFDTILNPQNAYPRSGVSVAKIQYLQRQVNNWVRVQNALITGKKLKNDRAWDEMTGVLNGRWPLRTDPSGRLIFDWRSKLPSNLASATRLNWSRAIFHVLLRAYVKDKSRIEGAGISVAELHQAYIDLKPVLVMAGLDSPSDQTFDKRLFRDANLFMPRSNDDNYLSFFELIEYVQNVMSGIDAGAVFKQTISKSCISKTGLYDENCFREWMQKDYVTLMGNMPQFVQYDKTLSQRGWNNILTYIENVVRAHGASTQPMSQADIDESFVLLQYVETLMMRFDTNHSGTLGPVELVKLLRFFAHALSGGLHGNTPQTVVPLGIFNNGQLQPQWFLSVDRGRILEIISYLTKLGL